ncbi:MAG: hypothetical protein ACQGVC_21695 [Myxococcota bacterium]
MGLVTLLCRPRALVLVFGTLLFGLTAPARADDPTCDPSDACCTQCSTDWLDCGIEQPFSSFGDFTPTRTLWLDHLNTDGCGSMPIVRGLAVGTCGGGASQFLYSTTLFSGEARFFDATGAFLWATKWSDVEVPVCGLETYFPSPAVCPSPTVTELHCSDVWTFQGVSVGGPINLPGTQSLPNVPALPPSLLALIFVAMAGSARRILGAPKRST